jgi:DNA-directed RNA polymerase specialized sigma24 family protein
MHHTTNTLSGDAAGIDADLLGRLHAGDRAAFAALYQHTVAALTAYAAGRLGEHHQDAAADVVHEAFCIALTDPTLLQTDPVASMRRLTTRTVHQHRRNHQRHLSVSVTYRDLPAAGDDDVTVLAVLRRPDVREAMSALSYLQRQTIWLLYADGHSRDDTARLLGRSPDAVTDLEQTALRRLQAACTG